MTCSRCGHANESARRLFCEECGKLLDRDGLRGVRVPGFVGVLHSTSPKIEEFWRTGDPAVFAAPGAKDYRP